MKKNNFWQVKIIILDIFIFLLAHASLRVLGKYFKEQVNQTLSGCSVLDK